MNYIIKSKLDNNGLLSGLDIDFTPKNHVLSALFSHIKTIQYPDFVTDISNSNSTGYEFISVRMYNDIDWED